MHAIGTSLGVSYDDIVQVIALDADNSTAIKEVLESFQSDSAKFRCSISNVLMIDPVIAPDKRLYEKITYKHCMVSEDYPQLKSFPSKAAIPVQCLKEVIKTFARVTVQKLEGYLRGSHAQEEVVNVAAECLSVLCHDLKEARQAGLLNSVSDTSATQLASKLETILANRNASKSPTEVPQFIYSSDYSNCKIFKTNLLTGSETGYSIPSYNLDDGCALTTTPNGGIFISGGKDYSYALSRVVVSLDQSRDLAVTAKTPMFTARQLHAGVFYGGFLYIIGGCHYREALNDCERLDIRMNQWELLRTLPVACCYVSVIEASKCLYALGGSSSFVVEPLDCIQKFDLDALTWDCLSIRLPYKDHSIASFKSNSKLYFVVNKSLWSFTANSIKHIKPLSEDIKCLGSCYYKDKLLYFYREDGPAAKTDIGWLK